MYRLVSQTEICFTHSGIATVPAENVPPCFSKILEIRARMFKSSLTSIRVLLKSLSQLWLHVYRFPVFGVWQEAADTIELPSLNRHLLEIVQQNRQKKKISFRLQIQIRTKWTNGIRCRLREVDGNIQNRLTKQKFMETQPIARWTLLNRVDCHERACHSSLWVFFFPFSA